MSFRVHEVRGDGNCMFRAVAQAMYGGCLSTRRELEEARRLRADVSGYIRRHPEVFEHDGDYLVARASRPRLTLRAYAKAYASRMATDGEYGQSLELAVLQALLHQRIVVHAGPSRYPAPAFPSSRLLSTELHVRYTAEYDDAGNNGHGHYDALIPRDVDCPKPSRRGRLVVRSRGRRLPGRA